MRKILIILAFLFAILGIVFAVLPMGTLGLLPVGLSLIFGGLAYYKSEAADKTVPKWLLIIATVTLVVVIGRAMMPDEVAQDAESAQQQIESQKEDLKDLEELE